MSRRTLALVLGFLVTGCASRSVVRTAPSTPPPASTESAQPASADSLATFIAKFRKLASEARPPRTQPATIEETSAPLKNALASAFAAPSSEAFRAVAREYWAIGIFDRSHQYLKRALALDPHDWATYDALARLWRDAGLPGVALTEAYRAVYYAPASPASRNTLGTVLQALGRRDLARAEYERALQLDPDATFALNNLCYSWVLQGEAAKAVAACERALAIEPGLAAARNNLALAQAVGGDVDAARATFGEKGDSAQTLYNTGIVLLARRDYARAARAFEAAHAARPTLTIAAARARQAAAGARNAAPSEE